MATEEEIKRRKQLNEELSRTNELLKEESESLGKVKDAFDSSLGSLEQINALHVAIKDNVSETEGLSTSEIQKQKQFIDTLRQRIDLEVRLGNISREEGEAKKKSLGDTEKQVQYMSEQDSIATKELNTVLKKDQNLISITEKFRNISSIGEKRLSTEELINARMQFGHMVVSAMLEKVSQLAGKILDIALEVDSASRELMRTATFSYEEARRGLVDITTAAAGSGLSMAESGKAMALLKEEFSAFTTLTREGQTSVGAMVGVLDKMGFASASSAKFLDMSTKSLGMSYQQSLGYLSSLKGFADQAGVSMKKISADLAANADSISNYGQQGIQVFKEMEIASKQLGMAMNELFAITEKFSTFEGAAGAAAQLNAVLGGDFVNSVDLLTASLENPIDVFKQFKQGMDLSGKSFDELDNGMKRVIASSMGVSVQQAGRLLGMDLNTATAAMKEQEQTQETLNEMSNRMLDIMDKLKTAFAALYPALDPIISILAEFADMFTTFATGFAEFIRKNDYLLVVFKMLATVIGAAGLALGVLGTTILPLYAQIKTIQLLFGGFGPAIRFVIGYLGSFGTAITNAIASTFRFAASIMSNIVGSLFRAVGAIATFSARMVASFIASIISGIMHIARFGIAMTTNIINAFASGAKAALRFAATLIGSLIPSFSGIIGSGFLAGTASMAAGEGASVGGTAASVGAKGFLALGAAALMVGAGIGLAAWGISTIVDSLVKLVSLSDGSTQTFVLIGMAMLTASFAIVVLTGAILGMVVILGALVLSGVGGAAALLMLSIGASAMMMGAGIALAAFGFSLIIDSLANLISVASQSGASLIVLGLAMLTTAYAVAIFTVAMVGMVVSLGLLAASGIGPAAVALLLAIGGAVLIASLGITLISLGFSLIVDSLQSLNSVSSQSGDSLMNLGLAMFTTAYAVAIFTVAMVGMIVSLGLLAASGVGPAAVGLILAIGGAVLIASLGITLISLGISSIVDSLQNLNSVSSQSGDSLMNLGLAMLMTSSSIAILSISLLGMIASLAILAASGAGPLAVGLLFAIAAATIVLGIGAAAVSLSMSGLLESLSKIQNVSSVSAESLLSLAVSLSAVTMSAVVLSVTIVGLLASLAVLALSGIGPAVVGMMFSIGAAAVMLGVSIAIVSYGLSLILDSMNEVISSSVNLVDSLNSVDSNVVSNYIKLVEVFSDLAESINKIDVDILENLNKMNIGNVTLTGTTAKITGPETKMADKTPSFENNINNISSQEQKPIYITVKIDSPVQLNKNTIGRYMTEYSGEIIDSKLKEARASDV